MSVRFIQSRTICDVRTLVGVLVVWAVGVELVRVAVRGLVEPVDQVGVGLGPSQGRSGGNGKS